MMHGFFRGPVLALALTTTSFVACMPGQLDTSGWLRDGSVTQPLPEPPSSPPPMVVDARPPQNPDTAPPPQNPDTAPPPPMPDAGAPDVIAAPVPAAWCTDPVEITAQILQPKCGACHGSSTKAGGLDLVTPGVKMRLIDIPSTICSDQQLVTMTPQVGGYFFDKLETAVAGCGDRMPAGGLPWLTPTEVACLKVWINPPSGAR
jgi:hypothetical protein